MGKLEISLFSIGAISFTALLFIAYSGKDEKVKSLMQECYDSGGYKYESGTSGGSSHSVCIYLDDSK